MPSPITAAPNGYEMNNINNTRLKSAIETFKTNNEIVPVNSDITDSFLLRLNELAPIN